METYLLVKNSKDEKKQIWKAIIEKLDNEQTRFTWTWGYENGKSQIRERIYEKGKVNRTSWEQALLECRKMMKDKIRKGYNIDKPSNTQIINDDLSNEDIVVPYPMLAHKLEKYPEMYEAENQGAYVMPKLDGLYCLAHLPTGKLWSRQRVPIVGLPHIENAILKLKNDIIPTSDWIVGELYNHGMGFQKITGLVRRTKHNLDDKDIQDIQFHVFDIIADDKPFYERYHFLKNFLPEQSTNIKLVEAIYVVSLQLCHKKMHKKYIDLGYEGIMIHPDDGPGYQQNKRTKWLLKYKTFMQEEFRCIEVLPLKHENKNHEISTGSVRLVDSEGNQFNATPKFTEEEKKDLWINRKKYIGQIATVQFFCKTDEKKVPRFPVLIGFRHADDM